MAAKRGAARAGRATGSGYRAEGPTGSRALDAGAPGTPATLGAGWRAEARRGRRSSTPALCGYRPDDRGEPRSELGRPSHASPYPEHAGTADRDGTAQGRAYGRAVGLTATPAAWTRQTCGCRGTEELARWTAARHCCHRAPGVGDCRRDGQQ